MGVALQASISEQFVTDVSFFGKLCCSAVLCHSAGHRQQNGSFLLSHVLLRDFINIFTIFYEFYELFCLGTAVGKRDSPYTGCVSESGDFKNVMYSKCFHLFNFNTYEHSVYIKEFRFNLTH